MAYEIDININGGDFQNDILQADEPQAGSKDVQSDANKGAKALSAFIVGQTITPFINGVKTQLSQNVGLITGSQELQDRINFGMQMIETGSSLVTAGAGGVALASSLGMSAGVGGVIGVAFAVVNMGMQIGFRQQQIDLRSDLEDRQIQHTKSRMGAGYNRSRTRGSK